jgi:hypothetical protein
MGSALLLFFIILITAIPCGIFDSRERFCGCSSPFLSLSFLQVDHRDESSNSPYYPFLYLTAT